MGIRGWLRDHRRLSAAVVVLAALVVAFGLYWFQPWKLLTRNTVDEAAPVAQIAAVSSVSSSESSEALSVPATSQAGDPGDAAATTSESTDQPAVTPTTPTALANPESAALTGFTSPSTELSSAAPVRSPAEPMVLGTGTFVDGEHSTTGVASVLQLPDGARYLRLEDFSTSDGPDVRVVLTDQPAGGDWGSFDDGRYLELGVLKGTDGNQNYPIPAEVDLAGLRSAVIWCERFSVAFGSAALAL